MRKLIITTFLACIYSVTSYAGVNVGFSGQAGVFVANGQETHGDAIEGAAAGSYKKTGDAYGEVAYSSVFAEVVLRDRLMIGMDVVLDTLASETTETRRADKTTGTTAANVENKVQVDFEDLTTFYAGLMITENAYIKAGVVSVDVITNEKLGTGGSYGNTSLDGTSLGIGYNKTMDNGMFFRAEGNYMSFDGASLTSGDMTVKLKNLDGVTGKLSVGKSF